MGPCISAISVVETAVTALICLGILLVGWRRLRLRLFGGERGIPQYIQGCWCILVVGRILDGACYFGYGDGGIGAPAAIKCSKYRKISVDMQR